MSLAPPPPPPPKPSTPFPPVPRNAPVKRRIWWVGGVKWAPRLFQPWSAKAILTTVVCMTPQDMHPHHPAVRRALVSMSEIRWSHQGDIMKYGDPICETYKYQISFCAAYILYILLISLCHENVCLLNEKPFKRWSITRWTCSWMRWLCCWVCHLLERVYTLGSWGGDVVEAWTEVRWELEHLISNLQPRDSAD